MTNPTLSVVRSSTRWEPGDQVYDLVADGTVIGHVRKRAIGTDWIAWSERPKSWSTNPHEGLGSTRAEAIDALLEAITTDA